MKSYWQIAARNVWRQKRRSILNIIAIAINIFAIVSYMSLFRGRITNGFELITSYQTGHVQVHAKGFLDEKRRAPLDINIKDSLNLKKKLAALKDVKAVTRRIEFAGSLNNYIETFNIQGVAIDPEDEAKVFITKDAIQEGSYLTANDDGVIIGRKLAELMGLSVGDYANLYSQTKYNTHNLIEVKIKGIFEYGFAMVDKTFVFLPMSLADEFLDMEGEVNKIIIGATHYNKTDAVYAAVNEALTEKEAKSLQVSPWMDFARGILEDIRGDMISMMIVFTILVIMAMFGIINTMSMNVIERSREIGTLRAIGLSRGGIKKIFIYESIIIGVFAVLIGWFFGFLMQTYLVNHGIPMPEEYMSEIKIPMGDALYGVYGITEYIGTAFLGLICALIGGYFPARKAAKLKIVDALHKI